MRMDKKVFSKSSRKSVGSHGQKEIATKKCLAVKSCYQHGSVVSCMTFQFSVSPLFNCWTENLFFSCPHVCIITRLLGCVHFFLLRKSYTGRVPLRKLKFKGQVREEQYICLKHIHIQNRQRGVLRVTIFYCTAYRCIILTELQCIKDSTKQKLPSNSREWKKLTSTDPA